MLRLLKVGAALLAAMLVPLAHAQKERDVSIGLQAAITSIDPHYHNLSPNNSLLLHIYEPLVKRDANQKLVPGARHLVEGARRHHVGVQAAQEREASTTARPSPPTTWSPPTSACPTCPTAPRRWRPSPSPSSRPRSSTRTPSSSRPRHPTCCCRATWARSTSCPRPIAEKAATEDFNSGKAAIGTGPYKFAEYVPNQRVVMKANYGYWGGEEPWDKVTFKILSTPPRAWPPSSRVTCR